MDEYADLSSESETEEMGYDREPDMTPHTPPGVLANRASNPFSMPNEMKPVSTPLMAIPATRTPLLEGTLGKDQALLEIPGPSVAISSQFSDASVSPSGPASSRADLPNIPHRSGSSAVLTWGQGLIEDLAGSATASFRRAPVLGEAKVSNAISPGSQDHREKILSDEDEDYWGGTLRVSGPSRSKKGRQNRAGGHRGSPYPDEDALRRVRRLGLSKHSRTQSKSLVRHLGVPGGESPKLIAPTDSVPRGRTRSRANSIVPPDVEDLSPVARSHVTALLQQLLRDARIEDHKVWETSLMPILSKVSKYIQPKVKEGASGYINNYVKIKRVPGAKPSSCEFLSGAVFTHKLAHKEMARTIKSPRILLIAFPLEYHRADSSQLMSLEPVMAQEKEYLKNLVNRMMAMRPSLVLVQNSVSGLALEYLLQNHVAVAYQVKDSAMSVISGLTGADIITSIDRLAFQPRVGKCETFEVKTYVNYDTPVPFKKTYFFFKGCPPELGCSIVLRGGSMIRLEKIKRIMELMVYVVYNLKLESSLIRDQFATQNPICTSPTDTSVLDNSDVSNEALLQKSVQSTLQIFEGRILSASPGVRFPPPYLVKKAVDLEDKLLKHKAYQEYLESDKILESPPEPIFFLTEKQQQDISDLSADQQDNIRKLVEAAEQRRLNQELQHCKSQWKTLLEREIKDHRALACPQDRQSISVLYSAVCTETGTPCTMPRTEIMEFYKDSANDWPLGQYIEDCVYASRKPCPVVLCGRQNMEHHRSYVHAQARVSVITEAYSCPLPGMQNTILMWNYCKKCDAATPLMPMSENTWAYSFGKYLELTFYDQGLIARLDKCSHNLCREHVRYFGFRDMAIRFDYDPVEIMGLSLPQPFVDWQPDSFVRLKNEEFRSLQFKITAFYDSLEFRLYNMNSETLVIEQIEAYKADLIQMRHKAKDERIYLLNLLQEVFDSSAPLDYLCLNRALRATQDKVTSWNETFDEMERLYLPSEKDIRRLTTAHLRKLFSLDDTSRTSVVDDESGEIEGKRSVSAPVIPLGDDKALEDMLETGGDKENEVTSEVHLGVTDRVVTMPVASGDLEEEPRGFHPRRTYEQLIKSKADSSVTNDEHSSIGASGGVKTTLDLPDPHQSGIPKPSLGPRHLSTETLPSSARTLKATSQLTPDLKSYPPSAIPIFRNIHDPVHLRKKSLTNNHVLSKQIQDIGESIVGSVEKRWNDQKRFSAQNRDLPQKNKAGETKVTSLAKHFEQLTREFEKERIRARKMLHSRGRSTFAVANQRPTVAVFDNVNDVVDDLSDSEEPNLEPLLDYGGDSYHFSNPVTHENTPNHTPIQAPASPQAMATRDIPDHPLDDRGVKPLNEQIEKLESTGPGDKRTEGDSIGQGLVPASERNTLMKTLSNFWADRSSSNWTPLEYPLPPSEHMFLESDVVVREDEPSSLIAFTLSAEEYISEMAALRDAAKRKPDVDQVLTPGLSAEERRIRATLQNPTGTHMKFAWGGDKSNARLTSRIFYAEQFDALRRFCGCDESYVKSLSRCVKWDSSGGKSGAAFLKTQDDRLIVKQMSKIETEQFLRFAPNYFEYMSDNFFNKLPVSLSKILGYYQITSKNPVTGKIMKMDVIVMENLFYKRKTSRIFDLKGSMRNRKVQQTGKENEVLLDENFVERKATWVNLMLYNTYNYSGIGKSFICSRSRSPILEVSFA